jgi:hypothetical protein
MASQWAAQTITITPGTLATASARQSAVVTSDNTVNVDDYRVMVKVALGAGTLTGSKAVYVWVYTSDDAGTTFQGNATGTDAAITLDSPHNFYFGCAIPMTASVTRVGEFSLKSACGGTIPEKWGIIIENATGLSFSSSATTCRKTYNT